MLRVQIGVGPLPHQLGPEAGQARPPARLRPVVEAEPHHRPQRPHLPSPHSPQRGWVLSSAKQTALSAVLHPGRAADAQLG